MSEKVSNEQIYELLKHQEERFGEFKADVNRQFGEIREDIHELKVDVRDIRQSLNRQDQRIGKLENQIESIRITWSTRLVGGILGTSAVTSAIVAYFVTQIS